MFHLAAVSQLAEEIALEAICCAFNSHLQYYANHLDDWKTPVNVHNDMRIGRVVGLAPVASWGATFILGNRSMAGQNPLKIHIVVRIHISQLKLMRE